MPSGAGKRPQRKAKEPQGPQEAEEGTRRALRHDLEGRPLWRGAPTPWVTPPAPRPVLHYFPPARSLPSAPRATDEGLMNGAHPE